MPRIENHIYTSGLFEKAQVTFPGEPALSGVLEVRLWDREVMNQLLEGPDYHAIVGTSRDHLVTSPPFMAFSPVNNMDGIGPIILGGPLSRANVCLTNPTTPILASLQGDWRLEAIPAYGAVDQFFRDAKHYRRLESWIQYIQVHGAKYIGVYMLRVLKA